MTSSSTVSPHTNIIKDETRMLQRAVPTSEKERSAILEQLGLKNVQKVYWNCSVPVLYEEATRRGEGRLAAHGPLVVSTGSHTGRSANDKFVVRDASSESLVHWGTVN